MTMIMIYIIIFNMNSAVIKVMKFYRYYIIMIVFTSQWGVMVLIVKCSNVMISIELNIEYQNVVERGATLQCTLSFISRGFSLSFPKL